MKFADFERSEELHAELLAVKHAAEAKGRFIFEVAFCGPHPRFPDPDDEIVLSAKRFTDLDEAITSIGAGLPEDAQKANEIVISSVHGDTYETIAVYDICDGYLRRRTT